MRAKDFIAEVKSGKISKRAQQPSRGISTYGDTEHISGDYVSFKLGQAMAMADGSGAPLKIDGKSWHGKRKTVQPYSKIENEMFKQAAKAVGASYQDVNDGDMDSKELEGTYTVSPISNWMSKK